jgi:hypothetical protein
MRLPLIAAVLVSMWVSVATCTAMELTDIDAGQRIDWSWTGYPGAIPDLDAPIIDVTQAAIEDAATPAVIYFPPGTYLIEARLSLKAGVVLRGAGYGATRLACRHADGCISVRGSSAEDYLPLLADAAKGTPQIEVADGGAFTVGQGGQIRQADVVTAEADWGA